MKIDFDPDKQAVVPREPTAEMLEAADKELASDRKVFGTSGYYLYKAMLSAAPLDTAQQEPQADLKN